MVKSILTILPLFLISQFSTSFGQYEVDIGQECITPAAQPGFCLDLRQCTSLLGFLQTVDQVPSNRDYLRNSQCPNRGGVTGVRVCCPKPEVDPILEEKAQRLLPRRGDVCGYSVGERVYGGQITKIDEFPWLVQLYYSNAALGRLVSVCAGALINEDHVVTAGHCVHGQLLQQKRLKLESVRVGEWNTSSPLDCIAPGNCADPVEDIPVAESYAHEQYFPGTASKDNDIGLIRLSRKVSSWNDFRRPLCLPLTQNLKTTDLVGQQLDVAGWGRTETGLKSDVKLKINVTAVSNEQCNSKYRAQQVVISPRHVCAGGKRGIDSCSGDSGAPLMKLDESDDYAKFWYLAGVVSFGPEDCGSEGWPGVYTRVNQYTDWIISKLR